ncbi:Ferri-bacillibactin esterase BesA [compost metagenome]
MSEQGGASFFLQFIEDELKPEINRRFPIDRSRQTIFGHSLGGLFVLHTMFTKPKAFQYYIAGSPSIHWAKEYLLEKEREFISITEKEPIDVHVLITMGELERGHFSRSNENAEELSARLTSLSSQGVKAEFKEFEGENHGSVLPILISRTLRFALKPN